MRSLIVYTLYLLTIFIPLIFSPLNSELFEFPKFILLLSGTLVITVVWAIHIYQTRDFQLSLQPSIIHSSLFMILITQLIATLFSLNPYTSFWGYYSRFHQGLLTTICYTIIYFAATKWLDKKSTQKLIKISVITAFIVSLYAILERLGIDKNYWVQDVQNRVFSTLGQPNWLAAYLLPNLFLIQYLNSKQRNNYFLSTMYCVLFTALLFTRSRSGLLAFGFSYLIYWLLLARQFGFTTIRKQLIFYSLILLVPIIIFRSPISISTSTSMATGTSLENGGTESGDIRKIVWTGALNLIKKYPLLGTGPETFAYTYYWERPVTHNMTSEWDFLYNKAHNEYLNIAAGAGVVGLLAYFYFHYAVFRTSLKKIPKSKKIKEDQNDDLRHLYSVLGAAIVAFTITNFFGFSVIPVYFMMILMAALPTSIQNTPTHPNYVLSTMYYVLILLPLAYPLRLFLADINYAKGKAYLDAGQQDLALPLLLRATKIRPGLDLYHSTLGEAYASAGQVDLALNQIQSTRRLNPYHLNYSKSRAKTYLTLVSLDPKYNQLAATELELARQLAPTDPKLAYNLGLVYTRLSDPERAAVQLQEAIKLKLNYIEPYYALTLLYEQTKQTDKIPDLLTSAKSNLATYSAQLKDKIEKYVSSH